MTIRVLVNGAFGKMGQASVNAIKQHPALELVGQTSKEYDLKQAIIDSKAQVIIDFTHPLAVYENVRTIIDAGVHPVIGTSGLTLEHVSELKQRCASLQLGGIIAPNFSIGAVLLMKYAKAIAHYLPHVEIIEMHHPQKLDSPSGTALYAAQMLKDTLGEKIKSAKTLHETIKGARGADYQGIPIHAVRLPGIIANLEIIFGNKGETLTLRHDTLDRECFMPGVCLACEKVVGLSEMVYGLEHLLD